MGRGRRKTRTVARERLWSKRDGEPIEKTIGLGMGAQGDSVLHEQD